MKLSIKKFLYEPKSKIGWVHGTLTILASLILGYLCMMIYSKYMPGDYGIKIVPSIILTPLLIACFSLWFLFSKTLIKVIFKFIILTTLALIILGVF